MTGPSLKSPVSVLKFVGEKSAIKLRRLGIETIIDLLYYVPRTYVDRTVSLTIEEALEQLDTVVTITARVASVHQVYHRFRRMHITTVVLEDDTGSLSCVWFRQAFIAKQIKEGDDITVTGKISVKKQGVQMQPSSHEKTGTGPLLHSGRIVPIYPETQGVTSKYLRLLIDSALPLARNVPETFDEDLLDHHDLLSIGDALSALHFPESDEELKAARRRLGFEELFFVQLHHRFEEQEWSSRSAIPLASKHSSIKRCISSLPYALTGAQQRSWDEISSDLGLESPMNRLLEGDVGSGKTVLAALSLLVAVSSGHQAVIVAPTEVLVRQHFESLVELLGDSVRIAMLTGKTRLVNENEVGVTTTSEAEWQTLSRPKLLKRIAEGAYDIILGTHAVLQPTVEYHSLVLVVVDEQHRFGVNQRDALLKRSSARHTPHLLSMTATPIPRSLSLTVFGHLRLSLLDELPPGRKKILTKLVDSDRRDDAYVFIIERLRQGRQAFIITPLVEESETLNVKAAVAEHERLQSEELSEFRVGLLHGRLKVKEKEEVMRQFSSGEIDVLVSTSVVEVGVNVPNASMMIIEGAERFGLSQLHQFRGRVGRGEHQSFCFLFSDTRTVSTRERLELFCKHSSGFDLAEIDMDMRGAGNIFGTEQSGIVTQFRVADLRDVELVKEVQGVIDGLLKDDPALEESPLLLKRLTVFRDRIHFE